jgi:predicted TIM-barrel fold metal-dependent hydrolase
MSHFGNPWWEEAWKMISSHKNIYADFSGGTCRRRSMDMWAQIFAPDGNLDTTAVGKLCFGTDESYFTEYEGRETGLKAMINFYERFLERLKVPEELRLKVWRENILKLTSRALPVPGSTR